MRPPEGGIVLKAVQLQRIRKEIAQLPLEVNARADILSLLEGEPTEEQILEALRIASRGFASAMKSLIEKVLESCQKEDLLQQMASYKIDR